MKTYAEKKAETERLTALLPEVSAELIRIPGVTRVAVGARERGGKLTDEFVFRVHVERKLPESSLPAGQIIPKSIRGVPVDVVVKRRPVPDVGFGDENDSKEYSPRVGGSSIGAEKVGGTATLGCFCRRTSDKKIVLLSNWHVLVGRFGAVGDGVGHPKWRKTCCCVCGRIGTVLAFDEPLDCAIAELKIAIIFATKVRRIRRADGTVEQEGRILGSAAPVILDDVYKVGARTGLTRGNITDINATEVEVSPNAPFTRMSDKGDSGSVYISLLTGKVCALHHSGDGTRGFGTPFPAVMTALGIDVLPTQSDIDYPVVDSPGSHEHPESDGHMVEPSFDEFVEQLELTTAGQELLHLLRTHRDEVLELLDRRRRFTVAWQRGQGPAFLAALARSARDPLYRIPRDISGVSRQDAAHAIGQALRATASAALADDLALFGPALARALVEGDTVTELLRHWEDARLPALR